MNDIHAKIGHFSEQMTLVEIKRRYFWHDRTKSMRKLVWECKQCQLIKDSSRIEELKNISICDLFYHVILDTIGPLPKTKSNNKYVLMAIDHYSKWWEAKLVKEHTTKTTTKILEEEIISRFGVLKYVFIDNGEEWMSLTWCVKFLGLNINSMFHNGRVVMEWLKEWSRP